MGRANPFLPRHGDRPKLPVLELREGAHVSRRVDDDLLPLEGRVEVRDDADLPAGRISRPAGGRDCEDLGRRSVLSALVEGAAVELVLRLGLELPPLRARSFCPRGRDDDCPPRDRVSPDLRRQLCDP
jgi:hypothetical protein